MNEIKAMEYLQWLDEKIDEIEKVASSADYMREELAIYNAAKEKFLSLITKEYEPGTHGA